MIDINIMTNDPSPVIPAKAGIFFSKRAADAEEDSRLRGNDV